MSEQEKPLSNRREFIKTTGAAASVSTLAGLTLPHVHAAEDNTIKIALIGCGGRGTGAAANALSVSDSLGPVRLHAMVDVFEDKMEKSYRTLTNPKRPEIAAKVDVTPERRIIGFDGYKDAMDMLRPGDVAIFTTPLAFRWVFFDYAIKKGINVFMEKPVTADGPTTRRMLELNKKAMAKNLKVGVGLMCRHCEARGELHDRIANGEIGEVQTLRAYRQQGPIGSAFAPKNDGSRSELMHQIRNFHGFLWLSGGAVSDFLIHSIDESCWMKDAWPVRVSASGGRHYRGDNVDQNFDHYSMEYTFEDGAKLYMDGRNMLGCKQEFASYAQGTKGSAVISSRSHTPAYCRIFSGQNINKNHRAKPDDLVWRYPQNVREPNPYELEWEHLIEAIRRDTPYNEVERGAMASLITSMGRYAAHTGQEITTEEFLNHEHEFSPNTDKITGPDSEAPIMPDKDGKYPIPEPGIKKKREY